jgi:anti-sigma-K factor RskA
MARSVRSTAEGAGTRSARRGASADRFARSTRSSARPMKTSARTSSRTTPSTPLERRRRRRASAVTLTSLWRRFGRVVLALCFLVACMLGCLWMRTQMVQDSFTVSRLNTSIAMLRQDVENRQTRLDALNAELPERASKLGLTVSDSSVQVDLTQPAPDAKDAK